LSIEHGELLDSKGNKSGQLDTIVVRSDCPRLDFGGADTFLAEGVFAVIETKSVLNRAKLREAFRTLRAVRDLQPDYGPLLMELGPPPLARPLRCVFAYELESIDPVGEELLKPDNSDIADIISVLGFGAFVSKTLGIEQPGSPLPYVLVPGAAASLGMLYLFFIRYGARFLGRILSYSAYFEPLSGWFDPFGEDDLRRAAVKRSRKARPKS
jgi:hypothetical protein